MASLSGNKIKDTYQSLIKLTDNGNLTTGAKQLTDGFGNNSPLYISTTQIGIGVTPEATYDLHVYQNAKVGGNLTITGDLTVNGTTTTVDTDTLRVEDPLIEVARNNTSSDAVDIGIYGKYAPSGTTLYAGLFRDTGDDKFKLFKSLEEQPTTTVNTSGTGYAVATLVANFEGTLTGVIASTTTATTQSANDNSTKVATTAYVDNQVTLQDLDFAGDSGTGAVDLDSQTFTIAGTSNEIETSASGQTLTIGLPDDVTVTGNLTVNGTGISLSNATNPTITVTDSTNGHYLTMQGLDGASKIDYLSTLIFEYGASNTEAARLTSAGLSITEELTVSGTGQSSFAGQVTVPATPSASTDAASKGYVDSQVDANNELSEVLANGNTTGGTDIIVSTSDQIFLPDGSATNPAIAFSNDTDSGIYHSGTQFIIAHAGSNKMIIANSQVTLEDRLIVNDSINADNGILIEGASNPYLSIHDETNETYTALWSGDTEAALTFSHSLFRITSSTNNFTGTDLVTITSGGLVGIGTSSPSSYNSNANKLVIAGSGNTGLTIAAGTSDDNNIFFSDGTSGDAAYRGIFRYSHSDDAFKFYTAGANERMIIDSSGKVGILKSSPEEMLDVTGSVLISNNEFYKVESASGTNYKIAGLTNGNVIQIGAIDYTSAGTIFAGGDNISITTGGASGSTRIKIDSSGNVGIGLTSPSYELDVSGEINATTRYRKNGYEIVGQNSTELRLANASYWQTLALYTNGTPRLTIDSSGKVGIGDTSPDAKLEVVYAGGYNEGIKVRSTSGFAVLTMEASSNSYPILEFREAGTQKWQIFNEPNDDSLNLYAFGSGASTKMNIQQNGNVGIGTTSPSVELDVRNDGANGIAEIGVRGGTNGAGVVQISGHGTTYGSTSFDLIQNSSGAYVYNRSNTLMIFGTNNTERMRIDASGNVSLASATALDFNVADFAQIKFKESGAITIDSDNNQSSRNFQFKDGDGSSLMFIGDNGAIGIGTTSPESGAKLDVRAGSGGKIVLGSYDANYKVVVESGDQLNFYNGASATTAYVNYAGPGNMLLSRNLFVEANSSGGTSGTVRIKSNGNVGIGTTSPDALLELEKSATGDVGPTLLLNNSAGGGGDKGNIIFASYGTTYQRAKIEFKVSSETNSPGNIDFYTGRSDLGTLTQKMTILGSGSVGIGNTGVTGFNEKLNVTGYGIITENTDGGNRGMFGFFGGTPLLIGTGDGVDVVFRTDNTERMRINSSGNVGIGTTNPQNKFVVKESSNVDMEFGSEADGCFIQTYNRTTSSWGYLRFIAGGGERMRITRVGGEVLINQTNDLTGQIFQVNGMIDQTDVTKALRVFNGSTFVGGIGSGEWAFSSSYATDYALYAQNNLLFHAGTGSSIDMMINSSGKVSVGVCSGTLKEFNVKNSGSNGGLRIEHSGSSNTVAFLGQGGSGDEGVLFLQDSGADTVKIAGETGVDSFINSGNVGIGTTSPNQQLDVSGNIAVRGGYKIYFNSEVNLNRYIGAASSNDLDIAADDDINYRSNFNRFFNGSTEFARLSGSGVSWLGGGSNGYVGIGTTSPTVPLAVHGQQKWYTTNADGNELRGFFNPGGSGDDAEFSVYKADGATEGVVWRGTGNSYIRIDSTSLKFINFYYGPSNVGQIVTGGSNVLYQSNSDYRLKENVVEMTGALDRVSQLKPSTYNFISHPEEQVDGFMAHELQEVVPQAVSGEKDEMNEDGTPKYQGVDHSQIVPLLVGAIKELKAEIETLKTQINK